MALEIEYKFLLDPQSEAALERHDLFSAHHQGPVQEKRLVTTYYDTPDRALRQRRAALRIRDLGQSYVMTVKGEGQSQGGLSQREEWEVPVANNQPDWQQLANSPFADLLAEAGPPEAYGPQFRTVFNRRARILRLADGTRLEAAIDRGTIEAADRQEPLHELELELLEGSAASLSAFAEQLAKALALIPGTLSKARRGYTLSNSV